MSVTSGKASKGQGFSTPRQSFNNDYPLVLLHGWIGWDRDELEGYKYWGGKQDLQEHLKQVGHDETYTVAVGPISSNWDRACECYAYLKGGRVDYGAAHAAKYKHQRFGQTYEGILKDWGTPGKHEKIHFITHSMGGQTARQLLQLLAEGDAAEREYSYKPEDPPIHELFSEKGRDWVHSLTTLSSPHDGTTLANAAELIPFIRRLFHTLADVLDLTGADKFYDFKLDQWNLHRHRGEHFEEYLERVLHDPFWNTEDISAFDLSPEGARRLNGIAPARGNVYYFSWSTAATRQLLPSEFHRPALHMLPLFGVPAVVMGSCTKLCMWRDNPVPLDQSWFANDGIVNTRSMRGPTLNSNDIIVKGNSKRPTPGQWNDMGLKKSWDHFDILGLNETWPLPPSATADKIKAFFEAIANQLKSLPQ